MLEDRPEYISPLPEGEAEDKQRQPFECLVIVNPRISPLSDSGARFFEGCLSVPGYQVGPLRGAGGRLVRGRAGGWTACAGLRRPPCS